MQLAGWMNNLNTRRQEVEESVYNEAMKKVSSMDAGKGAWLLPLRDGTLALWGLWHRRLPRSITDRLLSFLLTAALQRDRAGVSPLLIFMKASQSAGMYLRDLEDISRLRG